MTDAPLILTLGLHEDDQARFERLRTLHFPAGRNLIPAHVTLFHHLPGCEIESIRRTLEERCAMLPQFRVSASGLRFLGRGVAYSLAAPELTALRASLATQWRGWLTAQDQQGYRPHVTIQNKATPEAARMLLQNLQAGFTPFTIRAEALFLWRYLGGPWEPVSRHPFSSDKGP
jgi:2'-5' RNA ligase